MEGFLNQVVEGKKFELLIDTKIFKNDIVLKAAYNFLDKGYFFFTLDEKDNIVLQFTKKDGVNEEPKNIIGDFSDELLSVYLRNKLEIDNKDIREKIVGAAIANSIDSKGYVTINTDNNQNNNDNQIDFDKDIDEILREIENDPELQIDEEEITKILTEIEEEEIESESDSDTITIDIEAVKEIKEKFNK